MIIRLAQRSQGLAPGGCCVSNVEHNVEGRHLPLTEDCLPAILTLAEA